MWIFKAWIQKLFSSIPLGSKLYYLYQIHIKHSFDDSAERFVEKVQLAEENLQIIKKYLGNNLEAMTFFEFGVGWELTMPLVYALCGVPVQVVIDRGYYIRAERVAITAQRLLELYQRKRQSQDLLISLTKLQKDQDQVVSNLKKYFGIDYRAPCSTTDTHLGSNLFDVVTSNQVLMYPSQEEVKNIFRECHRILKPDGLMLSRVHCFDLYSTFDKRVPLFNYLKFSPFVWEKLINSRIHSQNRLRAVDYIRIAESAGFEVRHKHFEFHADDRTKLLPQKIHEVFRPYDYKDLVVKSLLLIVQKVPRRTKSVV